MAQSRSKKKLLHRLRQGKKLNDPRMMRGSWHGVRPVEKVRQSKKDKDKKYNQGEI